MGGIKKKFQTSALKTAVINTGKISNSIANIETTIKRIVHHPELQWYFQNFSSSENERDIIGKDGYVLRPDRLVFDEKNNVTIIDYKTGNPNYEHEEQLTSYVQALQEMGFTVTNKILVYTNKEIIVNKVNLAS